MSRMNRRRFLKKSFAVGAAVLGAPAIGRVLGANERVRVGVAGLHGRGGDHVSELLQVNDVEVVTLVDPDTRTFAKGIDLIEKKGGKKPQCVQDVRKALDDKGLDALTIATPNHWHSLMTIWACQAGKDVYVEKPLSHNVHEGRLAVEAARKHDRIVQHGTQKRSGASWARVAAIIKSGRLGKLLVSRALCYNPRKSIGIQPVSSPPPEVDFNLWLGPAREQPHHANLVHYNWHWFWDFGNGDIGNQGVHEMDVARWCIPDATLPDRVISLGGRFGYQDQGQTPNTQIALMDFGPTQLVFEVRGLQTGGYKGEKVGNVFHLEEGTIIGSDRFIPKGKGEPEPLPRFGIEAERGPGGGPFNNSPFGNFLSCVRSRKVSDLNAHVSEGHYSAALCHLANISYRLGEDVPFQPRTKAFGESKTAYDALERAEEHLKENAVPLEGLKYRLGRVLKVDPRAESIIGDPEAVRLLTRDYRAPFVPGEKVAGL